MTELETADDLRRQIEAITLDVEDMALPEAAGVYAASGYEVFPLRPNKAPYTANGMKDASADLGQVRRWWAQWPDALIGCRIPSDVIVLDIDPRHDGHKTVAALEAAHGDLPATRKHLSGRGDGGCHLWFRRPAGVDKFRGLEGVDVLRFEHRYSILPPSPHPDTGRPYRWAPASGPTSPLAEMPAWLADKLTRPERTRPAPSTVLDRPARLEGPSPIEDYNNRHQVADVLAARGWAEVGPEKWRHPQATADHSATVHNGRLYVYSPTPGLPVTETGDPQGLSAFDLYAHFEYGGDTRAAVAALRPAQVPVRHVDPSTGEIGPETGAPALVSGLDDQPPAMPAEFWDATPQLDYVKAYADAVGASAEPLLGTLRARWAVTRPYTVVCPSLNTAEPDFRDPLNLFVVLVAPSGSGKSEARRRAQKLLGPVWDALDADTKDRLHYGYGGTGEACLVDPFFNKAGDKIRDAVLITWDEFTGMAKEFTREGSKLSTFLRSAGTGGPIGERSRQSAVVVPPWTYRACVEINAQGGNVHKLLSADEVEAGTIQRFLLYSGRRNWPKVRPDVPAGPFPVGALRTMDGYPLDVPDPTGGYAKWRTWRPAATALADFEASLDPDYVPAPIESHKYRLMGRLACINAGWRGSWDMSEQDWELAGVEYRHGLEVIEWARSQRRRQVIAANNDEGKKAGYRETLKEQVMERNGAEEALPKIVALLAGWTDERRPTPGHVRSKLTRRLKPYGEAAISLGIERGRLEEKDGELRLAT